ncbi:DUF2711 family protein [Peribacillus alkalitolerans]|nr:DUF2711 family protein [Peribacillus alkalitolerans]
MLLTKDENIKDIIYKMNWEAITCNENTYIIWYSETCKR